MGIWGINVSWIKTDFFVVAAVHFGLNVAKMYKNWIKIPCREDVVLLVEHWQRQKAISKSFFWDIFGHLVKTGKSAKWLLNWSC